MFRFFKGGKEERAVTKDEMEMAVSRFLAEHESMLYTVLVNEDYTINYRILNPYLPAIPTNSFLLTKETLEVFEDTAENRQFVQMIDKVQRAVDQYVTDKESFPVVEGDENYRICNNKLQPYLKEEFSGELYISEKHYLVTSYPDRDTKNKKKQ